MAGTVYFVKLNNGEADKTVAEKLGTLVEKSNVLKFIQKSDYLAA